MREQTSTEPGYSSDVVWNLLEQAQRMVKRAEELCNDRERERLDTALIEEAVNAIRQARVARFRVLENRRT